MLLLSTFLLQDVRAMYIAIQRESIHLFLFRHGYITGVYPGSTHTCSEKTARLKLQYDVKFGARRLQSGEKCNKKKLRCT